VGANRATASVQEAIHLITAALEALQRDVRRASIIGDRDETERDFAVAVSPANRDAAGKSSFYREASLRRNLSGRIGVTVSKEGIVTALRPRLGDYVPIYGWEARRLEARPVSIEATFARTEDGLDLTSPPCMGTE
jgi:hypothetical protein